MWNNSKWPGNGSLSFDSQSIRWKFDIYHKFLTIPHLPPMVDRQKQDWEFLVKFNNKFWPIAIRKRVIQEWKEKLKWAEYQNTPEKYSKYINEKYINTFLPQLEISKETIIKKNHPGCPLIENGLNEYDLPVEIFWSCIHVDLTSKFEDPYDVIGNVQTFLDVFGTSVTIEK